MLAGTLESGVPREAELSPPSQRMVLSLQSVAVGAGRAGLLMLAAVSVTLALGLGYALWALARDSARVRRLNRSLRAIGECHQAQIHATDETQLLNEVCRIIVETGGYHVAWVGYAEQDEAKSVRPVAQAGVEAGYLETLRITWADTERGPAGAAIRTGQHAVARNVSNDRAFDSWRETSRPLGFASSIALPLFTQGQIIGAVMIYAAEPDAFDALEIELLMDLANDLAYSVGALRTSDERVRAEEALRENDSQLSLILNNVSDAIFAVAVEPNDGFRFASVNRRFLEATGLAESQIVGARVRDVIPEAAHALVLGKYYEAIESRLPSHWEEISDYPTGRKVGHVTVAPVFDARGICTQLVGLVHDVTEREKTERALHESERKYRELVENANSIILRWTHDGRITFLNEFGQRFFGYSADEIVGCSLMGTIVPALESDGRDLRQLMDRILADPVAFEQIVNENVRRNGERVWISWTNRIVRDEQGQVAEILSIGTDITERKETQDALRISEQKFMKAFHATPDAIVISRMSDGVLMDVNEVFLRQTGYTHDEARQRTTVDLGLWADPADRERYVAGVRADGRVREMEARFISKNGVVFDGLVSGENIEVAGELCLLTIIRDITERKRTEAELERHRQHLEELVVARTAELAVAKDRAEEADRLKSAFLATMSHELRTPLNSIIGFTGIILQGLAGPLNAEQHKQLEMVRTSARHLLALINDVLDISKIEAGQLEVRAEQFDVRASIAKVVGIVQPLAERKGLAVRVDVAPEIGTFVSDARRVEQALLNLLNNAIKFTEQGTVTLMAKMVPGASAATGVALHISVADTGIGIKQEDLSKLFQPFRQIDTGLSRQYEGTGLGLAICWRLAELLGGEIHAASEWGKGSDFTFSLPRMERGEA
jgi:two-component system, sensor histidine kinase and response regulator